MKHMLYIILFFVACYAALLVAMVVYQRALMYHPSAAIESPEHYGLQQFSDLRAATTDNLSVQMWYSKAMPGFPTIVYYHGNALNLGNRWGIYSAFASKGFGVLALSYRGYGKSEGTPTEQGIYNDARATIAFLTGQEHIPLSHIVLYGESLGTGVAVQMATEYDVAGVVLEAPYTAVADRAAEIYFYIPVQYLISDRFDSLSKIAKVKAPLLFLHGELDQTIPIRHGKALFAAATAPKEAVYFPEVHHSDYDSQTVANHVLDFAHKRHLINP